MIGIVIAAVAEFFRRTTNAGSALTRDDLIGFVEGVENTLKAVHDVFMSADSHTRAARGYAVSSGDHVGHVATDFKLAINRIVDTIMPESMSWLMGHIIRTVIDPMRKTIHGLQDSVRFLMGWRGQIIFWRNHVVDPAIQQWNAFRSYFYARPKAALDILVTWVYQQGAFADFALDRIARPLLNYISAQEHTRLRDDYTSMWLDASPDVWRHAEAAAVAILQTEQ